MKHEHDYDDEYEDDEDDEGITEYQFDVTLKLLAEMVRSSKTVEEAAYKIDALLK